MVTFLFSIIFQLTFYRPPLDIDLAKMVELNTDKFWILFTDKGFRSEEEYHRIIRNFEFQAPLMTIERRIKNLGVAYDFNDLPVFEPYIKALEDLGCKIRTVSNWLNGVSVEINPQLLSVVKSLPFVYDIRPLKMNCFDVPQTTKIEEEKEEGDTIFYGYSSKQIMMLGVHKVHNKGIYGSGVRLGLLDTGLKRKRKSPQDTTVNIAVEGIKVIKEHDFLADCDFFWGKKSNQFSKESIPNIKNVRLIESPKVDYLFSPSRKYPALFFITDTAYLGVPRRTVSYSYFNGEEWISPKSISYPLSPFVYHHPAITNDGRAMTFVAFVGTMPDEKDNEIYFGCFRYTTWQGAMKIENGRFPSLTYTDAKLYLVFIDKDSILKFKIGDVTGGSIIWRETRTLFRFGEKVKNPTCLIKDSLTIDIFALGRSSGKIYHLKATDGANFYLKGTLKEKVIDYEIKSREDTFNLFVKWCSISPLINLSYQKSFDRGEHWPIKEEILKNLSHLGSFDFSVNESLLVIYEEASKIKLLKSLDEKNWQISFVDTNEFHYNPLLFNYNNECYALWYRQGDDNTDYEEGEDFKEQPYHGTRMASLIAGYSARNLIGIAPAVEILVAKTEEYRYKSGEYYEYIVEEDNWVKGLEWCEYNGAKIISSSLGYRGWYSPEDFDGKTCITSQAASIAAQRGLVIVTAMGNRGRDSIRYPWPKPYIVAPGDADGILTIGGVKGDSSCWRGSGAGPTADGRIKPDLVALAYNAVVAKPDEDGAFEYSIGTSAATALVAGLCALALEVHPDWDAKKLREALFKTASQSVPSCTLGYGIPNIDSLLKIYPGKIVSYKENELGDVFPQPFYIKEERSRVYFPIRLKNPAGRWASLKIYSLNGKLVCEKDKKRGLLVEKLARPGRYEKKEVLDEIGAYWDGRDLKGKLVKPGLYFVVFETGFGRSVRKFVVLH